MSKIKNLGGFALIEIIGVIAIMAILAGAMAPFLLNQIDNSEADAEQLALEAIAQGVRQHYLDDTVANFNPPPYGTLPANFAAIAPYVGGNAVNLGTNSRGIARLYGTNGANLNTTSQASIITHLLVGGAAPTALAIACAGNAQEAADPCGDSPGTTTDDMPAGIAANLIKIVNLNLAEERTAIIERVRSELLAPFVAVLESSTVLDCPGINVIPPANNNINATTSATLNAAAGAMTILDYWGNTLQITKASPNTLTVWSSGPGAALGAPPANPLFLTATCASFDVNEQLATIADAIVGNAVAQNPYVSLAATLAAAGVTNTNDPWGTAINYAPAATSFTLTSLGPDTIASADDVVLTKSTNELTGLYAAMGRGFGPQPASPSGNYANCAAVDGWMTGAGGCNTALGYLINATNCNVAIAYDQECTVAGY